MKNYDTKFAHPFFFVASRSWRLGLCEAVVPIRTQPAGNTPSAGTIARESGRTLVFDDSSRQAEAADRHRRERAFAVRGQWGIEAFVKRRLAQSPPVSTDPPRHSWAIHMRSCARPCCRTALPRRGPSALVLVAGHLIHRAASQPIPVAVTCHAASLSDRNVCPTGGLHPDTEARPGASRRCATATADRQHPRPTGSTRPSGGIR